jgi:hypothetical protein
MQRKRTSSKAAPVIGRDHKILLNYILRYPQLQPWRRAGWLGGRWRRGEAGQKTSAGEDDYSSGLPRPSKTYHLERKIREVISYAFFFAFRSRFWYPYLDKHAPRRLR